MTLVIAEGLTKNFGEIQAVRNVDLKIQEGEIFGLLGPNGAGKTTTVRLLTTALKPTSGKVEIAGYKLGKDNLRIKRMIGVCSQDINLYDDLTGEENLRYQAYLYKVPRSKSKERIAEVLEMVELTEERKRQIKTYSGGMKRRLQIARALISDPKILFLDEPTLGLSPDSRRKVWKYIEDFVKEKEIAILLTTHYLEEADQLANRVAIIHKGKIIANASPGELKEKVTLDKRLKIRCNYPDKAVSILNEEGLLADTVSDTIVLTIQNGDSTKKILLMLWDNGIEVEEVSLARPTLEEAFIEITNNSHSIAEV